MFHIINRRSQLVLIRANPDTPVRTESKGHKKASDSTLSISWHVLHSIKLQDILNLITVKRNLKVFLDPVIVYAEIYHTYVDESDYARYRMILKHIRVLQDITSIRIYVDLI